MSRRFLLVFALGATLVACDDEPEGPDAGVTMDAGGGGADGGVPATDWGCLGEITPATPAAATISVTFHIIELATEIDARGVTVRACGRDDDDCATELASGVTDRDGNVTLEVPSPAASGGFDGFFEVEGDGFVPSVALVTPALAADETDVPIEGFVMRPNELDLAATEVGATVDSTRGHLVVGVQDCADGSPNVGAVLATQGQDGASVRFYDAEDGSLDPAATQTGPGGVAGVFNVMPGRQGVRADHATGYIGGVDDALVRAGHLTGIFIRPSNDEGRWSCLGSVPAGPTPTAATAEMFGVAQDFSTGEPVAGATYKVCARADTGCASPIAEGTVDANGEVRVTVDLGANGFDGFVEVSADGYADLIAFVHPPLVEANTEPLVATLVSMSALTATAGLAGATLDPERGHVAALVRDCASWNFTPRGATVAISTADDMTTQFYVDGAVPSRTATETFSGGGVGVVNLPAGAAGAEVAATITSTVSGTQAASYDFFVRAGYVHTIVLFPDPS